MQGDQLNIAVFLWNLVKSDLSIVRFNKRVHCTLDQSLFSYAKVPRKAPPCLTGQCHPAIPVVCIGVVEW